MPNVVFLRQKSSWTNTGNLCDILRRIAVAVAPWMSHLQPLVLLDCARQHVGWRVPAAAARHRIWLAYIPASLTWLLQPCDAHLFGVHKSFVEAAYASMQGASPSGDVSDQDWLRMLNRIVRYVLQGRCWAHAFAETGFVGQGAQRREVQAELGPEELPAISAERPSNDQLQTLFPAKCKVPAKQLWRPLDTPVMLDTVPKTGGAGRGRAVSKFPAPLGPEAMSPEMLLDIADAGGVRPWMGRLRPVPKPSGRALEAAGGSRHGSAAPARPRHAGLALALPGARPLPGKAAPKAPSPGSSGGP